MPYAGQQPADNQGPEAMPDPFAFAATGGPWQGLMAVAMLWAAPWRAVAIVAEEAMRETGSRER